MSDLSWMKVATLGASRLVGIEDGYMWLLGAVEHREAPDCHEMGGTKLPRRMG